VDCAIVSCVDIENSTDTVRGESKVFEARLFHLQASSNKIYPELSWYGLLCVRWYARVLHVLEIWHGGVLHDIRRRPACEHFYNHLGLPQNQLEANARQTNCNPCRYS